jgi:hypothetical protein
MNYNHRIVCEARRSGTAAWIPEGAVYDGFTVGSRETYVFPSHFLFVLVIPSFDSGLGYGRPLVSNSIIFL